MRNIKCPTDISSCTACMLCLSICPNHSIEQVMDEHGFYYPNIDETKCVNCGLCSEECPSNKPMKQFDRKSECFAFNASDSIRNESSSGGAFSVIAEYFLDNEGYVCGAAFNDDMQLYHILISDKSDLNLLRKSKYVQSNMEYIWKDLDDAVLNNKLVLFSGTPCQCAAVRAKYGSLENLYIIDILCMGVSSQHCFNKYIKEEFVGETIKSVNFRHKKNGWSQNLFLQIESDKNLHEIPFRESSYFLGFLKAITNRDNCANCHYAGSMRQGNITIGDFWGIDNYDANFSDKKGTSLVLINDEKGKMLFNLVVNTSVQKNKQLPIDWAMDGNATLKHPTEINPKRGRFWDKYNDVSLRENIFALLDESADCGIINYWYTNDHGAILTAYALQCVLSGGGIHLNSLIYVQIAIVPREQAEYHKSLNLII